jgi:hypothetical protein
VTTTTTTTTVTTTTATFQFNYYREKIANRIANVNEALSNIITLPLMFQLTLVFHCGRLGVPVLLHVEMVCIGEHGNVKFQGLTFVVVKKTKLMSVIFVHAQVSEIY